MKVSEFENVSRVVIVPGVESSVYERWALWTEGVEIHLQDDGRTVKIFPRQG